MPQKSRPHEPSYYLLEESRESWNHIVSDKVVYALDTHEVTRDPCAKIAKNYIEGKVWIEVHLTFETQGNTHFVSTLTFDERANFKRQDVHELGDIAMDRNSPVLVDVTEQIQTPQKVALDGSGIPSVIRLKRFDDGHCVCGYSGSLFLETLPGVLVDSDIFIKNRELRALGIINRELGEPPNQLIQRRTQAVKEIPKDQWDLVGGVFDLSPNDIPSMFKIVFSDETARFRIPEDIKFLPQTIKMYLRPTGLKVRIG